MGKLYYSTEKYYDQREIGVSFYKLRGIRWCIMINLWFIGIEIGGINA